MTIMTLMKLTLMMNRHTAHAVRKRIFTKKGWRPQGDVQVLMYNQTFEGHFLHKGIQRDTTVGSGKAVGWQGVIGAGGIIASAFRGVMTDED